MAEVYDNALAVPTTLGVEAHGHLGAVMPDATNFQKTGAHFVLGADPRDYNNLNPNNATSDAQKWRKAQFNACKQAYKMCLAVKLELKNQITKTVKEVYPDELNDPDEGLLVVKPDDMLQHSFNCFGIIAEPLIA